MIRDEIFELVKERGPVLPGQIAKLMKMDSLLASAYLSELVSSKKICISSTKVGGSPLYYALGQEIKLQDYRQNLDENEQKAYDLLKKDKVVNDADLGPLMKYTFRSIKDFAVPLKVNKKDIFWKWYLIPNDGAVELIKAKVKQPAKPTIVVKKEEVKRDEIKEEKKEEKKEKPKTVVEPKKEQPAPAPPKPKVEEQKPEVSVTVEQKPAAKEPLKEKPKVEKTQRELSSAVHQKPKVSAEKEEVKKAVVQETLMDPAFKHLEEFKRKKEEEFAKREEDLRQQLEIERKVFVEELKKQAEEVKKKLEEERLQKEEEVKKQVLDDTFFIKIRTFFDENKIKLESYELIKKGKELDFVITVPSAVGEMRYYCKAKDKKKVNEGDLSTAYLKGQSLALPVLFLTTGELVKRASEMIGKEFKLMLVKKL